MPDWLRRTPYPLLCTLLGLALGWLPIFFHGPIPEKFYPHFIRGDITVWAYYGSRVAIGFFVGITVWPTRWWMRGPLLGALLMIPTGLVSLSVPITGRDAAMP